MKIMLEMNATNDELAVSESQIQCTLYVGYISHVRRRQDSAQKPAWTAQAVEMFLDAIRWSAVHNSKLP